jgi:hypothetical protein
VEREEVWEEGTTQTWEKAFLEELEVPLAEVLVQV